MFKFLQKRRADRATISELTAPYFASPEYQLLVQGRNQHRERLHQLPPACVKHFWRVNRESARRPYYPGMIFFVCDRCGDNLTLTRTDVYTRMAVRDLDIRVIIATNTRVFMNEAALAMSILRSERN